LKVIVDEVTIFVNIVLARGSDDIVLFFEELLASKTELSSFLDDDGVPAREMRFRVMQFK